MYHTVSDLHRSAITCTDRTDSSLHHLVGPMEFEYRQRDRQDIIQLSSRLSNWWGTNQPKNNSEITVALITRVVDTHVPYFQGSRGPKSYIITLPIF